MRTLCLFFFLPILLSACSSAMKQTHGLKEELEGSWLIYEVGVKEANEASRTVLNDTLTRFKERYALSIMHLGPDGEYTIEDSLGNLFHKTWEVLPPDMIGFREDDQVLEIFKRTDTTLTLTMRIDHLNKTADLAFACYRVLPERNGGLAINDPKLNSWRQRPSAKQSKEEIRARLVSLLRYNSIYLNALNNSSGSYFNTRRFHLPFRYYNGGIGLADFDSTAQFSRLYFNAEDARYAYGLLAQNLNSRPYPRARNYMVGYATFMKELADVIESKKQ